MGEHWKSYLNYRSYCVNQTNYPYGQKHWKSYLNYLSYCVNQTNYPYGQKKCFKIFAQPCCSFTYICKHVYKCIKVRKRCSQSIKINAWTTLTKNPQNSGVKKIRDNELNPITQPRADTRNEVAGELYDEQQIHISCSRCWKRQLTHGIFLDFPLPLPPTPFPLFLKPCILCRRELLS
jgi:hypothetical protein